MVAPFWVILIFRALDFIIALYFATISWVYEIVQVFGAAKSIFTDYKTYFLEHYGSKTIYSLLYILIASVMACLLGLLVTQLEYWVVVGVVFLITILKIIN